MRGLAARRRASSWLILAIVALGATPSLAADLAAGDRIDLQRALKAVGPSSSEEPAVRLERQTREPSPAFMLGAALGAWASARDQLDFDLRNPAAAGAPHASQGAANADAIADDCSEEAVAFGHLDDRARALGALHRWALLPGRSCGRARAACRLVRAARAALA